MGGGTYRFVILKNYPETLHFDIPAKSRGIIETLAGILGLGAGKQK